MENIDLRRIDKRRRAAVRAVRAVRKIGITYEQLKLLAQVYKVADPENYDRIMQEYYVPSAHWIAAGMALKKVGKTNALWKVQEYQDLARQRKEIRRMNKNRRLKRSERAAPAVSNEERKSVLPTLSEEEHSRRLQRIRDAEVL